MDKQKKKQGIRHLVQGAFALLTNLHLRGFVSGQIYGGALKRFCVPGMNCYSCPAAIFACPIGSLQASLAARKAKFPFYVLGYLTVIGVVLGRFICGWFCLFGLLQELLYKIPLPKIRLPLKIDACLRKAKYLFLIFFVMLLPLLWRDAVGLGAPRFCKYICPVGALEAGIPLVLANENLRAAVHGLYAYRLVLLGLFLLMMIFVQRPFCKYVCPLGAVYSLFQPISYLQLHHEENSCVHCGACAELCQMDVDPTKTPNAAECIRCAACVHNCPTQALSFSFRGSGARCRKKEIAK